jgi:O-antigen/teichoic acid export membrane protein
MASFVSGISKILRGTVFAQAIAFASLPLITRMFDAGSFGTLQALQNVFSLLTISVSLRYEIALLSANEEEFPAVLSLCVLITILSVAVSSIVIACYLLYSTHPSDLISRFHAFVPLGCMLLGLGQILTYISIRLKLFEIGAGAKIAQSATYSVGAIGLGALGFSGAGSLLVCDAVGRLALILRSLRGGVRAAICTASPNTSSIWAAAKRYRNLPLYSLPSAVINTLGSSFTALILLSLFSSSEAGSYAIVERAIGAPIALIAGAVSQAFMSTLANHDGEGAHLVKLFRKILVTTAAFGLVPAVLLALFSPTVVPLVLGEHWNQAGEFARLVVPSMFFALLSTCVNMTLVVLGFQRWQFAWDVGRSLAFAFLWTIVFRHGIAATKAIMAYSIISTLFYIAHIAMCWVAVNRVSPERNQPGNLYA